MGWQERQKRVEEQFACECAKTEIRYRVFSNGTKHFFKQCLSCGEYGSSLKKADIPARVITFAVPVDEELRSRRQEEKRAFGQKLAVQEQRTEALARLGDLAAYYRSDQWKRKREAVIARDQTCKACEKRPAVQAHHLTYVHVFSEPLFDLIGVCVPCHEAITMMDRKRRGVPDLERD